MNKPDQVYTTYIRTTPDRVWAAITNPEFSRQYWGGGSNLSDWKKGSKWRHSNEGHGGSCGPSGEVIESTPPSRLVLTWAHPDDPKDTRWEYTYHQRLFKYEVPSLKPFDQIEILCQKLAKTPHTRRAQAITWKVWEDNDCYDPACMQSVWCRLLEQEGQRVLSMNVRFRSNDAYKAAFMNIFALVQLQQRIAKRIAELSGQPVQVGRYCHMVDSYHIYGSYFKEFEGRFLGMLQKRSFEQRTLRYEDVREMMEEARPMILEKAKAMGKA